MPRRPDDDPCARAASADPRHERGSTRCGRALRGPALLLALTCVAAGLSVEEPTRAAPAPAAPDVAHTDPARGAVAVGNAALVHAAPAHAAPAALAPPETRTAPKTLVLGLDGIDHVLTRKLIDEGRLPNLARLAERGAFRRLDTSFPAQSPVSWAVFNSGTNPGMFGVDGFVSRYFRRDEHGLAVGTPLPKPMLGDATMLELPTPLKDLPSEVPYEINPMQGTNWWQHLDDAGVRFMGVQLASVFPPDREGPRTHLLAGLGLKDISGSPGSWAIYTDDPWTIEKGTASGGRLVRMYFDERDGAQARTELRGPRNWIADAEWRAEFERLEQALAETEFGSLARDSLERERDAKHDTYSTWRHRSSQITAPMLVRAGDADRRAARVEVEIDGTNYPLRAGQWSELVPVRFELTPEFSLHGVLRLMLQRVDADEVRIYTTPIQIDPRKPPPYLPLSAPRDFAPELAEALEGPFETLGWAAPTNPFKDEADTDFGAADFLQGVDRLLGTRRALLEAGLARSDEWDVYFQVFSAADRVQHMLFAEFDPLHPRHDAGRASELVRAFDAEFPLRDAIPQVYMALDRVVGSVLERIDAGEFGPDALLLVASDHGFQSFRRGVNLNNLLHEAGFLHFKEGRDGEPLTLAAARKQGLLGYVDWSKTRAYSMGLGKIFLNVQGREPTGIVHPDEVADLIDAIQRELLAARDVDGAPLLSSLVSRDVLFHGPWVHENPAAVYQVAHTTETQPWDGFADLFAGFAPGYRVSWNNTMGGVDEAVAVDNLNNWSGGHVSVDPAHVAGVLFSSRPLRDDVPQHELTDIGPTILARHGVDPRFTQMEGAPLLPEQR